MSKMLKIMYNILSLSIIDIKLNTIKYYSKHSVISNTLLMASCNTTGSPLTRKKMSVVDLLLRSRRLFSPSQSSQPKQCDKVK